MPTLILASSSLGRKKLLEYLKIPFQIIHSNLNEDEIHGKDAEDTIRLRARLKGEKVTQIVASEKDKKAVNSPVVILSADSDAIIDGRVVGKAADENDGVRILSSLSGRTHLFMTSVHIIKLYTNKSKHQEVIYSGDTKSLVTFRKITEKEIRFYLSKTDFTRYAGSYALISAQNFITKVEGSLSGVIGLPLEVIIPLLPKLGLE